MRFSKLSGIATGLVLTFAGQTFGHDIDPADSCSGYSCSTPGQQCGPGVQGAYNDAYVCSEEKQWVRVPSTWEEDPSLFALLFHGHDHDEVEGLFNSSENESMFPQEELDDEIAQKLEGMFTQEELDDEIAQKLEGMVPQEELDAAVAEATEGMVPQEDLDAAVAAAEASAQTSGGVTLTRHEHEYMKITACTAIGVCQANGMTQVRSEYSALVAECGDATWSQNGRIGDAYAVATKDVNIFQSKVGHRGTYLSHRCEDWFE